MITRHSIRPLVVVILAFALLAVAATVSAAEPRWDLPTRLVDEPPGFAQLRARYAPMTMDQLVSAGFQPDPLYVTAALVGLPAETGAMGYHAINPALMGAQFPQGIMDPLHPPVILLGADQRVIGVEWEAAPRAAAPQLYGQTANLGPVHPGVDQPHYMLHAYFRPDGKVLFGDFDPTQAATTPGLPNTGAGGLATPPAPLVGLGLALACGGLLLLRRRARHGLHATSRSAERHQR